MVAYQGIAFSYTNMLAEIRLMQSLAGEFLSPHCDGVLDRCCDVLENIRSSSTDRDQLFEIPEYWPIRTVDSAGEYRASGKDGGRLVYGTLSFRWEIRNPDRGRSRQAEFHLVGEATTSIQLFETGSDKQIARWQLEAGDANSPGCHFHAAMTERRPLDVPTEEASSSDPDAVSSQRDPNNLFPDWLKIPRLPSILLSPMDGLEFLLGELFQRRWLQVVSEDSDNRNSWANSQGKRLERLLDWKRRQVRQAETTPWMALKKAKPELGLLSE